MTVNTTKTKMIAFRITSRTAPDKPLKIKFHSCNSKTDTCQCKTIEQVSCVKYLGILIDEKISWRCQIEALTNRVKKLSHIFKKLQPIADLELMRIVYLSLCQTIINYCIGVWGAANKTCLLKLERAQRSILKIAYKKPWRYSTDALYTDCNHLRVRQLFICSIVLRFHKKAKEEARVSYRSLKWDGPRIHTSFAYRSYTFLGPFLYNKFYKSDKNVINTTYSCCKSAIYKWLESKDYREIENLMLTGL